jgi:hypothetical protein
MLTLQHRAPPAETEPITRMNLLNWLHLPFFFLLVYLLWSQARRNQVLRRFFWPALLLKLAGGVLLGYIYLEYFGGGDMGVFHQQASAVKAAAKEDPNKYIRLLLFNEVGEMPIGFSRWPGYSNSFFFVKLLSLLHFLTGSSFWGSGLYLSLFSFWGCWYLVDKLQRYFPEYGPGAIIAFLFFPSVVFWTSGVSKDSVFMGSLCLTVGLVLQLSKNEEKAARLRNCIVLLASVYLLWKIKFFLASVILVLLFTWLLIQWLTKLVSWLQPKGRQLLAWGVFLAIGTFVASFAHPTFNLDFFARHIVWNYTNLLAKSDPTKPLLLLPGLEASLWSVVKHAPEAVFQMLFRPFVWEAAPLFYKMAGIENLLLLLLVAITVLYLLYLRQWPRLPGFLAVLLVFFFIGAVLVSLPTPNLGTLFRYRAPLLPFFLMVVLAWGPWQMWFNGLIRRRR